MNIFVIMRFEPEFNLVYRHLIKDPLEADGHIVRRADDSPDSQNLLEVIIQGIVHADLIIAELTGKNSNVHYELGIAHTLHKDTIQIAQDINDVQFNLRPYNTVLYSIGTDGSSDLVARLRSFIANDKYKYANPVNDYSDSALLITDQEPGDSPIPESQSQDSLTDEDYGIVDARADAEESMDTIGRIVMSFGTDFQHFSEKLMQHKFQIDNLNQSPTTVARNRNLLQILAALASDVDAFAGKIDAKIPKLRSAWNRFDQGMGHLHRVSRIESETDCEAAESRIRSMATLSIQFRQFIGVIRTVIDAHMKLTGVSRVTNPSMRRSVESLEMLIEEVYLGDSIVTRLSYLTDARIAKYREIES